MRDNRAPMRNHALNMLLSLYEGYRPRVAALPMACLGVSAVLFAASMPLPWHHRLLDTGGIQVVRGIDGASWLVVAAAVNALFLIRFVRVPPGFYAKWLLTLATVLTVLGMFSDYINWNSRAGQLHMPAYYGPGFYVAVLGMIALVVAAVACWRTE